MISIRSRLFLTVSALSLTALAAAEEYKVDTVHSAVFFRVKHMNVSYTYGRFNEITGLVKWDDAKPGDSSLKFDVKTASVDTNDEKRDAHLRNADFFDADKYPTISFVSKSVKKTDDDKYEVAGELTLHGVTKPLTVTLEKTGMGADPWGGHRIGFETVFTIKRSEFGMDKMMNGVGDDVRLMVSIEGVRQ